MEWYYQKDGERVGPVSDESFSAAVSSGDVLGDTLVWNESMTEWEPYSNVGTVPEPSETIPEPAPTSAEPGDAQPIDATVPAADKPVELPGDDSVVCRECGCVKSPTMMISFENRWICADCKDVFFQKVKEGVALEKQDAVWEPTNGATPNSEIAAAARECLRGKLMTTYGILLLYGVCQVYRGVPYLSSILKIFLKPPFVVGFARYFLLLTNREDKEELVNIFSGFSKYGTSLGAMILRGLAVYALPFALFLISAFSLGAIGESPARYIFFVLLFVAAVTFIFLWFALFFVEWVIAADEELGVTDSLSRAWHLASGHRFKLFSLCLRYFWLPVLLGAAMMVTVVVTILDDSTSGDTGVLIFIGIIFAIGGLFYIIIFLILPFYFSAVAIFFRDIHKPEYE